MLNWSSFFIVGNIYFLTFFVMLCQIISIENCFRRSWLVLRRALSSLELIEWYESEIVNSMDSNLLPSASILWISFLKMINRVLTRDLMSLYRNFRVVVARLFEAFGWWKVPVRLRQPILVWWLKSSHCNQRHIQLKNRNWRCQWRVYSSSVSQQRRASNLGLRRYLRFLMS